MCGVAVGVERAVMTGAEEPVVLGFPIDHATEMGTDTGESNKVGGGPLLSLTHDDHGLSAGGFEIQGGTGLDLIGDGDELPSAWFRGRGIEELCGDIGEIAVTGDKTGPHGNRGDNGSSGRVNRLGRVLRRGHQEILFSARTVFANLPENRPFIRTTGYEMRPVAAGVMN